MNSLEFIDKLIVEYEKSINNFIRFSKRHPDKELFIKCATIREEELNHLRQIKTILEAWEVARDEIRVKKVENNFYIYTKYENGLINKQQYEAFKKALEVKDNGTTN